MTRIHLKRVSLSCIVILVNDSYNLNCMGIIEYFDTGSDDPRMYLVA